MGLKYYVRRAISLPPHVLARKLIGRAKRKISFWQQNWIDTRRPTYLKDFPASQAELYSYFCSLKVDLLKPFSKQISALAGHYINHYFDLLGSGWVKVSHGIDCQGLEGNRYEMGQTVHADSEGRWLKGRINPANLAESQRIWQLIDSDYVPIDWHIDFKSGYRWSESTRYLKIVYGHKPGVDIKAPWELARMQHLPQLAWAYKLANDGLPGFDEPHIYCSEFRNQILDFIATNPPRFGVNWRCTMDVAIRVANWLVAYDLFGSYGVEFDSGFRKIFIRSVYEHGLHIINNLEWNVDLRSNHYLSNIVGLLFVAAYLPRTPEIDCWLAFAVQELVNEVRFQFNPDGTNFEASTSYHRLSAELVVYATALVLGLSEDKQRAFNEYDHLLHKVKPRLKPAPLDLYPLPSSDFRSPFPAWYFERLEKMAEFTMHISHGGNRITQIGDNDSGRFLKIMPSYREVLLDKAGTIYLNLSGCTDLLNSDTYWLEDHLDHRHLVAAINGLFGRDDFHVFASKYRLETEFVHNLCGKIRLPSYLKPSRVANSETVGILIKGSQTISGAGFAFKASKGQCLETAHVSRLSSKVKLYSYPDFGLYIYKSEQFKLAVRCGPNGQNGNGGHAHNDQLSFELSIDGTPIIVDPGTYLYTPAPDKRNLFRSTAMHNTLVLEGREQNSWLEGREGLFSMRDQAKAMVGEFDELRFVGEHSGFGPIHKRTLMIFDSSIEGVDECNSAGKVTTYFHLAPDVDAKLSGESMVLLNTGELQLKLFGNPGKWSIKDGLYSAAYGMLQKSQVVQLESLAGYINWKIEWRLNKCRRRF